MKSDLINKLKEAVFMGEDFRSLRRGIVDSVDEENYIAMIYLIEDSDRDDKPIIEASIRAAVIAGDCGILLIPAVESIVTIGLVGNSMEQAVLLQCSEIEKVVINVNANIEVKIADTPGKINIDENGVHIGEGTEPLALGDTLKAYLQTVDDAIDAIIQWGAGGLLGTGGTSDVGGIAPLAGVVAPAFDDAILSENHKTS